MLARVLSAAVNGIEAFPVELEVNSCWGDTTVVRLSCNLPLLKNDPKTQLITSISPGSRLSFPMADNPPD
jgi:hypothetical protein